jgi:hypothetical protein
MSKTEKPSSFKNRALESIARLFERTPCNSNIAPARGEPWTNQALSFTPDSEWNSRECA